jgi:hypothetical protein
MKRPRRVVTTTSEHWVLFRTYALALAVALSPAFFQTAYSCERGDTYLLRLEFEIAGKNRIVGFHPDTRSYDVATGSGAATVRTEARKPDSTVTYQWLVGGTSIEPSTNERHRQHRVRELRDV